MKTLFVLCSIALFCVTSVSAQDTCSAENDAALAVCISDATAACVSLYPGCEGEAVSLEDALALLDERCGACEDSRNFGKYNSCLKKVRNGLRTLKAYSEEIASAFATARSDCKSIQKEKKNNKGKGKPEAE